MNAMIEFDDQSPSIQGDDIDDLSQRLGVTFPASARRHYLEFNGGIPSLDVYDMNGELLAVQQFFSIKYGVPLFTIEDNYEELALRQGILPKNLLPFAIDPGGDYYCLSTETGEVSIFRPEFLPDHEKANVRICESIDEFTSGLSIGP